MKFCLSIYCILLDRGCSCQSELLTSFHVQRWSVPWLYNWHVWRVNCWSTGRLHQR